MNTNKRILLTSIPSCRLRTSSVRQKQKCTKIGKVHRSQNIDREVKSAIMEKIKL